MSPPRLDGTREPHARASCARGWHAGAPAEVPALGRRARIAASTLWRSPAFARTALDARGAGTRLYGFHQHYGEDVLAAARAGGADARALAGLDHRESAGPGDPWHPYVASTRIGNWVAALTLEPALATPQVAESLGAPGRVRRQQTSRTTSSATT